MSESPLHLVKGTTFDGGSQELDGMHFEGCRFIKCKLIYNGGKPPHLIGNQFEDCSWSFGGAAGNTVAFLAALNASGGHMIIKSLGLT